MHITIDIDEALLAEAQTLLGTLTTDETVNRALRLMVQMCNQQNIKDLGGKVMMSEKR